MQSINLVTASELLGICRQRIQQLIYAHRVKGAFKSKQGWVIPLYRQMPQIIPATRGVISIGDFRFSTFVSLSRTILD